MNLERTKPETLAAAALDLTPSQSLAAHDYAERLNAALARLGLTERLTLPPAPNTAIDELPAVVDVPLRKTLSVLMGKAQQGDASALATLEWTAQVAESIFAGLHARASVYPLALPSHESLATLSQGVDALLPRKISTGWSVASLLADPTCDGIDDGVSLVRLLCSDAANSVTELKDDNEGWVMTNAREKTYHSNILQEFLPNLSKLVLGCRVLYCSYLYTKETLEDISLPNLELVSLDKVGSVAHGYHLISNAKVKQLSFPKLISFRGTSGSAWAFFKDLPLCRVVHFPKLSVIDYDGNRPDYAIHYFGNCESLEEVRFPKLTQRLQSANMNTGNMASGCPNLVLFEIGDGYMQNLYLAGWNPTTALSERLDEFISNFKTYIANRLTDKGSGKTLTLSQAVRDAIEGDPTIAQIITSKGWTISPAPSV